MNLTAIGKFLDKKGKGPLFFFMGLERVALIGDLMQTILQKVVLESID